MFGHYEIEYEGQRYFGNVLLREIHVFQHEGVHHLVDVDRKAAYSISERLLEMIKDVDSAYGALIPESAMAELQKLGLLVQQEDMQSMPPVGREAAVCGPKREHSVVSVGLLIAQDCNMRCIYCYGDGGRYDRKGLMTEETAFRAVDWLMINSKTAPKVDICFFGGEPLLNFTLMKKVVPYARKMAAVKRKKVAFKITTNGTLLNDEIIRFIEHEEIEPLISFDGPAEYHNRQRPFKNGRGSYARIVENVRRLRAVIPHLSARATVCGDVDPFRIKEGMKQAGFTNCYLVNVAPVLLKMRTAFPSLDREQTLQRMLAFNRKEAEQLLTAIRERRIHKDCLPGLLPIIAELDSGQKRYYSCGVGKGLVSISVSGDIYPCHRFTGLEEFRLGNIKDYRAEGLNEFWRAVVDQLPECKSCWARYFCGGGCFYFNRAHTGDMHRSEPLFCLQTKAMFEGLIHVFCELSEDDKEYLKSIMPSVSCGPYSV